MKKLVLYGAGGFGREVAFMVERINREKPTYDLLGFVVGNEYYHEGEVVNGYPVVGDEQWLIDHRDEVVCTCAVGEPKPRAAIQTRLMAQGVAFETLISPDVEVHPTVRIGAGTILCRGVRMTVNVTIGDGVLINENVGIGHDVVIEDYACLMGGCALTGHVHIGKRVFMGGKAYLVPNISAGDDAVIAAGSVVFRKVKAGTRVLGNPARRLEL